MDIIQMLKNNTKYDQKYLGSFIEDRNGVKCVVKKWEQVMPVDEHNAKIDEQIDRINVRYNPLCQQLEEGKQKREHLLKMLEQCNRDQKSIMNDSKNIVNSRRIDESKLSNSMASLQLQLVRGFSVEPNTTFKQTKH